MSHLSRIASRLYARQMSLLPEYQQALRAYVEDRNVRPMVGFLNRVVGIIYPNDQAPAWASALSSTRRNAWRFLVRDTRVLLGDLLAEHSQPSEMGHAYLRRRLEDLAKPLRALEIMSAVADEKTTFQHGPFRVFTVPGVTSQEKTSALGAFDAATEKIRPKFPQVLYGDVYLATTLAKSGPYVPSATYQPNNDTIQLSVRAKRRFDDIYTITHELGHRFDFRFVQGTPRYQEFVKLSTRKVWATITYDRQLRAQVAAELFEAAEDRRLGRPFQKLSPEAELWAKQPDVEVKKLMSDYLAGRIDGARLRAELAGKKDVEAMTGELLHGPLAVTPYGATKPGENFADAFAHFVLDMPMPAELQAILAAMQKG